MNNLLPPIIPSRNRVFSTQKDKASPIETFKNVKDKSLVEQRPFVERRKKPDRRNKLTSRTGYDTRGSRGRRRSDRGVHPSIEIDV